ncbi:polysaccharide deacetylase family protein [Phaeospirillum tilakii]|uniref:Chitooligosaccharide deacetylase n=1 Tax=Phaeospirillum tilakii TaxID=741673 RepID=A0ABW5CBZ2_9PROT
MRTGCAAAAVMIWLFGLFALAPPVRAADSAVVLLYHRFDDDRVAALNTTSDQLASHIAELKSGGFTVLPLPEIAHALREGRRLPDKTVAITVDDASYGFYSRAWPLLRDAGLPVTLFVATDEIDHGGETLGWSQLRELRAEGVTIGSLGAARLRFPRVGVEAAAADLGRAQSRFAQELGTAPDLFAWPGGEADAISIALVRQAGFLAAFGQHSGALWRGFNPYYLPRFIMIGAHGELDRFRLVVRSLPLPAVDLTPADPVVRVNPPAFGFTLAEEIPGIAALSCYASHEGQVRVEQLGPRIEVRMTKPIPPGRARLNCTLPTLDGRWRWFGWQFATP